MTNDELREFESALLDFVKRATKETATTEEVEALPGVAAVLVRLIT